MWDRKGSSEIELNLGRQTERERERELGFRKREGGKQWPGNTVAGFASRFR